MIVRFIILLILSVNLLVSGGLYAQVDEQDNMYLVLLDMKKSSDIALCYSTNFDKSKVKITYAFEDSINYLSDFIYEEEALIGPECFIPELKLVFRNYTYVVSLYCSKVIKYENKSAFVTSSKRMQNDLIFTESVMSYLKRLKQTHFGSVSVSSNLIAKVVTSDPLDEISEDGQDLDMLLDENDEDDDSDLEIGDDLDLGTDDLDKVIIEEEEIDIDKDFEDLGDETKTTPKKAPVKKKGGGF
ncbi:MAG: hypothetical protein KDD63_02005 [Bacteroidetes bacterium]|nr:hypothetical protein [Bacteroidota bacterium]MCB0850989.1 hypothetical protein [Bacteroidota bacterium]